MRTGVINDTHIGVRRQSGTTGESQALLNIAQIRKVKQFCEELIDVHGISQLLVNGDLFDRFEVDKIWEIQTFEMFRNLLDTYEELLLVLSRGNHDASKNTMKTSSFDNLCHYLQAIYPDRVMVIKDHMVQMDKSTYVIPHMPNQELFDAEMEKALLAIKGNSFAKFVCVHANFDNGFAVESDQSLNVSRYFADRFQQLDVNLIFGHEHQARQEDNVYIDGVQFPTSVSDCLREEDFYGFVLHDSGKVQWAESLKIDDVYVELDWATSDLPQSTNVNFIKLVGTATHEQATDVVRRLAELRKAAPSTVAVISNGVKVERDGVETVAVTDLSQFDLLKEVLNALPEDYREFAESLV